MLIPNKFNGYHNGTRQLHFGSGGGGGGPTQTTSTVQNTNIPSYAQPYVESMLGATQKQLFNTSQVQTGTDETTGQPIYTTQLDSFKPYQAYGGTYDAQGNQLSYDPSKGIAGINAMQGNAYNNTAGMQFDPTRYNMAQLASEAAGRGGLDSATKAYGYGAAGQQAGLQGQALGLAGGNLGIQGGGYYGGQGFEAGLRGEQLGVQGGGDYGAMGAEIGAKATQLAAPALGYGAMGAGYGYGAQQLIDPALTYGAQSAGIGSMGLGALGEGADVSSKAEYLAGQQAASGRNYARQATNPYAMGAYMSPYMQNVVDVQNQEAQRGANIASTARGAQAARAGAFGGSRQAIENAEANRALAMIKNQNQAQGLQQAYQQAQQAQQFGANLGLQGQSAAQQGLGVSLAGTQTGLQGLGTALQGQQGALAGIGQAGNMYGLGIQGAQTGLQGVNAANAAYQTGIQGANTGLAGVDRQLAGVQLAMQGAGVGLQGVNTQLSGVDRQLAGTAQGMQGAQVGLQGVQGAQAGYGLANQSAANLTSMLGQQQANQLGLYNNQMAMGNQKMAYDQSIKNQAVLDYANAQQYPLMQLGTMSNMLRGLPMQASTTNQYAASPNPVSQAVGTIGAGASIYNAMGPRSAAGGEVKGYAKGGIMSYDMGGEVEDQLESMDEKGLQTQARESSSPSIRKMAQRLLRERQMSKQPQGTGPMGVQYQAAQPQMPSYAPGGIVAFAQGKTVYGGPSTEADEGEAEAKIGMQERLAQSAPTTGGIMGATAPPATPVPYAPQAGRAMQQAPDIPAFMKAEYADAEKRMNAPLSDFMAERRAALREAGVADASEGQQQQRAEMMAEKANMKDEKERQKYMRMAEFFASWGSTPGPTLVAGLNALQKTVPNIVADEREQKKARREIDKSIADLDNATRLEKRGEVDAAMALKLKAAEDMKALNIKFIDYQSRRESDASSFAATKYNADMQFRSEQLRATTARLDRAARRETDADSKAFGQYQTAANQEQRLISKIADQAKMFEKDYATIKTAEMNAGANDGKMNPALVPGYEAAKKKIADQEAIWTKQKEQAAADTDLAYKRVRINPEAAKDYTKPNAAPASAPAAPAPATSGPISGEFSAPTQAHIAALKSNPTQAAAFDLKFGPGAANEYLGK